MSIENKLTYLNGTKEAIKQAIIDKGVSVTEADTFRSYASKIEEIQGGSGGDCPKNTLDLSDGVSNVFKVSNEIKELTLPSSLSNVTNMESAFQYMGSLTSITLPSSLPNVTNMSYCFQYCTSLRSIILPDLPKVTKIYALFNNCRSLTSITLPSSLPNVTDMGYCFQFCDSLTSITLPSNLSKVKNMYGCFSYCESLSSITLPDLPNITEMYNCFGYCTSLTSLTLPDLPKVTNMYSCFNYCALLQNLVIGSINPNITTLTNWGISTCTRLTVESLVNIMNSLPTITNTRTCTIGRTNLSKLSPEQLAIATNKGWTIN